MPLTTVIFFNKWSVVVRRVVQSAALHCLTTSMDHEAKNYAA